MLNALVRELDKAVASYLGLRLTIISNGFPVVLTAFADGHDRAVLTSLRVPLTLMDTGFAAESRVVFYAGTPGAFVDLAADLKFALDRRASIPERAENPVLAAIRIDADPPPRMCAFDLSGVSELSTIDHAVGVLIDQGHHPDRAHAILRRDAARAGLEPHAWAAQLLQRTHARRPE